MASRIPEEALRRFELVITPGIVAPADRGSYGSGAKEEGRAVKLKEWKRLQAMQVERDGVDTAR